MWTRSELKEKAKVSFKANYWLSVLAALIITLVSGASGGSSGRNASNSISTASKASNEGGIGGVIVLATLLGALAIGIVFIIIKIVVGNALLVGSQKLFIKNEVDFGDAKANNIGFVFKEGHWKNVAITMFLMDLFTSLWTLLFIIPGIIKGYEYKMIPYLLAEDPEMSYQDAFAKSKEMMHGQKWNAFVLDLSFIGWHILSAFTLGILGVFYVMPYYYQTSAELYLTLKNN